MTRTRGPVPRRRPGPARLLIIEDEEVVADALGDHLSTRFGREVVFVGSRRGDSDDLVEFLRAKGVTIVIVDVNLVPATSRASDDESGIRVARRIRREFGPSIAIILMSRNQRHEERIDEIPADCFVSKLAPLHHLAQAVDALRKGRTPQRSTSRLAVDGLTIELAMHEVRLAQGDHRSPPVRLEPAPLVLFTHLARERAESGATMRSDFRWLVGTIDGGIKCRRGDVWDRDAVLVGSKTRHDQISASQVTNWKFKINEQLRSFARIDVVEGPPPGPRSREMPFELAPGVRGDRIRIV